MRESPQIQWSLLLSIFPTWMQRWCSGRGGYKAWGVPKRYVFLAFPIEFVPPWWPWYYDIVVKLFTVILPRILEWRSWASGLRLEPLVLKTTSILMHWRVMMLELIVQRVFRIRTAPTTSRLSSHSQCWRTGLQGTPMAASPPHTPPNSTSAEDTIGAPPRHSIISSPAKPSGNPIDSRRDIAAPLTG